MSGSADLAARIERAYMQQTGADSPRGARAWFARKSHSLPGTVTRWLAAGELPGPALGLLEQLEATGEAPAAPDDPARPSRSAVT